MYLPLSKKHAASIRQLALKKYRLAQAAFVLEGKKSIQALLSTQYIIKYIVGTSWFYKENPQMLTNVRHETLLFEVDKEILSQLGSYKHNHEVLAVIEIPPIVAPVFPTPGITLALDDIQDPGNLGTIIRIADWYGIKTILCSKTTVDLYNPKVLQASMGSFVNINLHYVDLLAYLQGIRLPILGAQLSGCSVHNNFAFPADGILVIGNESHGIHPAIRQILTHTITIPKYGQAQSLNAAIATAILCDNWKNSLQ